jgi:hypothetical protein
VYTCACRGMKFSELFCLTVQRVFRAGLKLIAFELAGKDRDRRETPVFSRLKIAFFALYKRG